MESLLVLASVEPPVGGGEDGEGELESDISPALYSHSLDLLHALRPSMSDPPPESLQGCSRATAEAVPGVIGSL